MTSSNVRLPNELLAQCLGSSEDIIHMWTTCRNVSRTFRDAVDHRFRTEVLPSTKIEFDWANWEYLNEEELTERCFFNIELAFAGFKDDEKEIAYFRETADPDAGPEDPRYTKRLKEKWMDAMNMYGGDANFPEEEHGDRFDLVPWTILVRSFVNDTALPGYKVDYDAKEISFRWKEAYQCFFREADFMRSAEMKNSANASSRPGFTSIEDRLKNMRHQPNGGQQIVEMMMQESRSSGGARTAARKAIRRHRIAKHYRTYIEGYTDFNGNQEDEDDGYGGFDDYFPEEFGEKQKLKRMDELETDLKVQNDEESAAPFADLFSVLEKSSGHDGARSMAAMADFFNAVIAFKPPGAHGHDDMDYEDYDEEDDEEEEDEDEDEDEYMNDAH